MSPNRLGAEDVLRRYNEESLPDFCEPLTDVNQIGTFGNRPIHLASYRGDLGDIQALVEAGADVDACGDLGRTPLHDAVTGGHLDAVRLLLERGASPDVRDELGETPIDLARHGGRMDIFESLKRMEKTMTASTQQPI